MNSRRETTNEADKSKNETTKHKRAGEIHETCGGAPGHGRIGHGVNTERNSQMSCFINPVEEDQCVFVAYEGEMTRVELMAARYEANALLAAKRWNGMVVNIAKLRSSPMTLELIDLASDLSSDLKPSTRIALVVRPDQVKNAKLVERVARIEGVFLSFFLDVEEATIWAKGMNFPRHVKPQPVGNPVKTL